MPFVLFVLVLALSGALALHALPAADGTLNAEAIMLKVAANQDRAEKLRNEYVYQQRVRVTTRRTNGKLARDEDGLAFSMAWVRHHDKYADDYVLDPAVTYEQPREMGECCKHHEERA